MLRFDCMILLCVRFVSPGTKSWCPTIYGQTNKGCQNVTFVSLMSMSSGIIPTDTCEYQPGQWQYEYCLPPNVLDYYNNSIADVIQSWIRNPLMYAPGPFYNLNSTNPKGSYTYVNWNFVFLSYFIQKLSGMALQNYYQTNIFSKVGISSTSGWYDPWSQAFELKKNINNVSKWELKFMKIIYRWKMIDPSISTLLS